MGLQLVKVLETCPFLKATHEPESKLTLKCSRDLVMDLRSGAGSPWPWLAFQQTEQPEVTRSNYSVSHLLTPLYTLAVTCHSVE